MLTAMIVMEVIVTRRRDQVKELQRVLEITILSFSLRIRSSTNFYLG